MPIAKLSSATARLIGSSAGITSPYAVVKELLDNAIDAGADAIEVALSPNTLDQVRVRDNGRGIALDDLDSLGRHAHTSKLTAFDELTTGQVCTLGFRGQALASINTVATVDVVTRTADEPVATKVRLSVNGGIGERFVPVSAPTGTTVQVAGLFGNMPPRRQLLMKEAKKTTTRIKELMMAYALANAALRISFKVLGDEKQSCKFGQTRNRDLKQSVIEVFGAAVAANGQTHRFASAKGTFTLMAFLPSLNSDQKVFAGKGSFISVNGRPICSATGIGKALTGVFKTKMQHNWQQTGLPTVQKPLLLLEILCSFADYDANIATMKDEVLFADSDVLLQTFEELCGTIYSNTATLECSKLNRKNGEHDSMSMNCLSTSTTDKRVSVQMRTACKVNMLRTNSNTTDEGTDFKEIEVTVPERRQVEIRDTPRKNESLFKVTTSKLVHGIERYFQPTGADFEIATDDTATPERPQAEESSIDPDGTASGKFERMPLNDVSDSTLNILAGIDDSPPSDHSSQQGDSGASPRLSDLHGTSWSIQRLMNQHVALHNVPSRGTTASASPPTPPPRGRVPQTRGLREDRRQQVVQQRDRTLPPVMRTPPASDPMREEPRFVPASYVGGWHGGRQPSPVSSSSSESGGPAKEAWGREQQQQQQQRGLAIIGLPSTRNGGDNPRGVALGVPRMGRLPATRPRQQTSSSSTTTTTTMGRPLARQPEYEADGETAPQEEVFSPAGSISCASHLRAHLLRADSVDREASDVESAGDSPPQPKRQRAESQAPVYAKPLEPGYATSPAAKESESLPLESIPPSMATWRSVLTTDVDFSDVRMSMDLERDVDEYIQGGYMAFGLNNVTRRDAMCLESRMRRICQV
ncbi:hypothetical protein MY11210_001607 [Beauveria gryllotalpidicola]